MVVEVDLGGDAVVTWLGQMVSQNEWHNFTISHNHLQVTVSLDDEVKVLELTGQPHLYIDPEIYIGGGPELQKKDGNLLFVLLYNMVKYVCLF